MNTLSRISIIIISIVTAGCVSGSHDIIVSDEAAPTDKEQYIEGSVNILFSEEMARTLESSSNEGSLQTKSDEVNSVFESLGVTSYRRLFPDAGEFEPRTRKAGLHRWYKVTYNQNIPVTKAMKSFAGIPGMEICEPVRKIALNSVFNDPKFGQQWHYFNDGRTSSDFIEGADINVVPVWNNYTVGNRSVIVAVVDAGVDYEHEDLAANYVGGKNFGTGGKVTPDDHGTHVAGTIAAANNNGIGVCGIAGGDAAAGIQGVGILGCQIFSGNNPAGGAEAIKWAADNGAVIANNSWGYVYETEEDAKNARISAELAAAIDYFIQYAGCDNEGNQLPDSPMKGGVVLFSAGNDGWRYNPIGEYEPVVAVGAIGPDYTRAYYSCYGDWVDISAPGGNAKVNKGMVYSTIVGNKYDYMQGTSMSCPHASGVAALIASHFGGPGFSNDMLLERLIGGARKDVLPASSKLGPLVDALGSFTMGGSIAPEKVEDFGTEVIGNRITLKVNVTADEDDVKTFEYAVFMAEDPTLLEGLDIKAIPEGVKEFRFKTGSLQIGDVMDMVIPELEFEKEYFFAIAGCDYSLNYSEISPVKSAKTGLNNAPVINPSQAMEFFKVRPYETLTLAFEIHDPEGSEVQVKLGESRSGVTIQKNAAGIWILTITGSISKPGTYDCTVIATDMHGLASELVFNYEVLENSAPVPLQEFENLFVEGKDGSFSYDLSEYFSDPDGETLTYTVTSSNNAVCKTTVSGNKLDIDITGYGLNELTIKASDAKKASCSLNLSIMAKDPQNLVEIYPVPVTDVLNIRTGKEAETLIEIRSATGDVIHRSSSLVSAFAAAAIDMTQCAPGRYVVAVAIGGETTKRTITKI